MAAIGSVVVREFDRPCAVGCVTNRSYVRCVSVGTRIDRHAHPALGVVESIARLRHTDERAFVLRYVQPGLVGLIVISLVRKRFLAVSLRVSLLQVALGGVLIVAAGVALGSA